MQKNHFLLLKKIKKIPKFPALETPMVKPLMEMVCNAWNIQIYICIQENVLFLFWKVAKLTVL